MEDRGFSPEVFALNDRLISDEITLIKADDGIVSNLTGTWSNDSITYTFENDGTYEVKTSNDSYWGMYFIINENQIVLGRHMDDLKVYDYILKENSLALSSQNLTRE